MTKQYHLDQNEVAFVHCLNSAFAGLHYSLDLLEQTKKGISKKVILKTIKNTLAQTNTALTSEFIRGELIKKNIIENDPKAVALITYDPSTDNTDNTAIAYSQEELDKIRLGNFKNAVKGR